MKDYVPKGVIGLGEIMGCLPIKIGSVYLLMLFTDKAF